MKGSCRARGMNGRMKEELRRKSCSSLVTSSSPLFPSRPNRAMCLVFIFFFPPYPILSLLIFFSSEKVGGGRPRWQDSRRFEVCPIPGLNSAPHLLWSEPGRLSVSFSFSPFPRLSGPLSYQWPNYCIAQLPSCGRSWKSQQGGFTRRIMIKSPACSRFT